MNKKKTLSDKWIVLLLFLVTAVFAVFHAAGSMMPVVIDDICTMANAAFAAGYNWSTGIEAVGGYYFKYAQMIFQIPFFILMDDPFMIFKAIIITQSIFFSVIPSISYIICRRHLKISNKWNAVLLALVSGLMPSVWLYSFYARAEMILLLLPWIIMLCLLEAYKAAEEGRKKAQTIHSILIGFLAVFAYMAHTRGIVFIMAVFLVVVLTKVVYKKDMVRFVPYIITTVIFLVLDSVIKDYFYQNLYAVSGTQHSSVESFDFSYMSNLFTLSGIKAMIYLCLGWLYNVFCSTYGLVTIALVACVIILVLKWKKRKDITLEETTIALFSFLMFAGSFVSGVLFFFKPVHLLCTGERLLRTDRLVYGRYILNPVGLLALLALYVLLFKRDILKAKGKMAAVLMYLLVFVAFLAKPVNYLTTAYANIRYCMSFATFLKIEPVGKVVQTFEDLPSAFLKAGLLFTAIFLVIIILSLGKKRIFGIVMCCMILISSMAIFEINYVKVKQDCDEVTYDEIKKITYYMMDMGNIYEEYPAVYIDKGALRTQYYVYVLKDYDIYNKKNVKRIDDDNFMIISYDGRYVKQNPDEDYYRFDDFDPDRDMIIIKGEELKAELEARGYSLTKYIENQSD